jgi:cytochrome P450
MRLYPPVWFISREAAADCEIGGFHIPRGSEIAMSQWIMHRSERYFPNALAFRPERWENQWEKQLQKYVYFPFGSGPRICIGNRFAEMEAVLLLASLMQRFRLTLPAGPPVIPEPSITLRPKHGIRVRLIART